MSIAIDTTVGYPERTTCSLCGKRRMCNTIVAGSWFGLAWTVCREHGDWLPKEGVDFTVTDEEEGAEA